MAHTINFQRLDFVTAGINLRCPFCLKIGVFQTPSGMMEATFVRGIPSPDGKIRTVDVCVYAVRVCPNADCGEPVFVVTVNGKLTATFPPETLEFDSTNLPPAIGESFKEAVRCHAARCYKSAAIMVRRTLEEVCEDRGATGADLKKRLQALRSKVVLPVELLDAADELRLLGNDAVHIESKDYDDVGKEQAEAGIGLCKEILKAVYQLKGLVEQLRKLKQKP